MKAKIVIPVLLAILLVSPMMGRSQVRTLSVDEAVQWSVQNNAGLRAANFDIESQIQLKRTSTEIPKTVVMFMSGQYNSLNKDNNITITQSLPFPTVFTSQSKLGELRISNSESKKAITQNDLSYQVRTTYLMLQFLNARQKLLSRQDTIFADLAKITSLQYKTGEGTLLQKTSAEARHNEVMNMLRQNEADQKVYQNQLQILLNSIDEIFLAQPEMMPMTTPLLDDTSQIHRNPMLAYQQSLAHIALQEKKVEANRGLPDLTVGYFNQSLIGYQRQTDGSEPYFGSSDRFTGFMAGISIPIWFVPHHARVKSASSRAAAARSQADYFQKQLKGQWEKAVQEFRKNANSLQYYAQSALPNAKLILSQTQLAYKTGEISQSEYRLNLQQVVTIEEGYLQSLHAYNQSIITLEFLSAADLNK